MWIRESYSHGVPADSGEFFFRESFGCVVGVVAGAVQRLLPLLQEATNGLREIAAVVTEAGVITADGIEFGFYVRAPANGSQGGYLGVIGYPAFRASEKLGESGADEFQFGVGFEFGFLFHDIHTHTFFRESG